MKNRTKICQLCKREFSKPPSSSWNLWESRKFCSKQCQGKDFGEKQTGKGNHRYGKKNSREHNEILRNANKGARSHLWKGDEVDYRSLHAWVVRWKGQPSTCEGCGKTDLIGHDIQWANIDGRYRRILDEYIRLCAKCHWHYDRKK